MRVYGVDFTCAPRKAKPITVAGGQLKKDSLLVDQIEALAGFGAFEAFLARPGPWIGGFDFPFSLPRELVRDLGWPSGWAALVSHCSAYTRLELRACLDAYRQSRKPGNKYAHRETDIPAGSSSPMKLVNPPVALMFHEGARRLALAQVHIPDLQETGDSRIALEAYPGLLVRRQLGLRESYKSDTRSEHTAARSSARRRVVQALKEGRPLGMRAEMSPKLAKRLIDDGSGDSLDAVICALQAAWGWQRRDDDFGMPRARPAGEGWIVTA